MKKIINLINVLLISVSLTLLSSCNRFKFDDKYFIGVQEHFYEIRTMEPSLTTDFICDMVEALDMKVFRLNVTLNNLFYVGDNDTVNFQQSTKLQMRKIVDGLLAAGVERIVYATDSFLYPTGYQTDHHITVPDPYSEKETYIRWLEVNSEAYKMMAESFPEIKYYEPINEPDNPNGEVICMNGMLWGSKDPNFMYSEEDEANICADLCYYIRKAIKSVSKDNKMMTPALTTLDTAKDYLESIYTAIESGAHPIGNDLACSVDPDDYFDIIDLHPYSAIQENYNQEAETYNGYYYITDDYVSACMEFYEICKKHGDKEKPHWYTETGYSDKGDSSIREFIGEQTTKQLELIKNELPFVETVIFYVLTDTYVYKTDASEEHFGLFTAVADPSEPLEMKPIMESIYKFMHDGSTDYSKFEAVRNKYINSGE